jgi:hypothetical protein
MNGEIDMLGDIAQEYATCSLCGDPHLRDSACAGEATLPDSGARSEFATGAVRDASIGKGYFAMIPPEAETRIARRFEDGARKYGPDNWRKGIPLSRYFDAMRRHLSKWALGHVDEDHLGAVGWNYAAAVWTEREIYEGRLPDYLNDLPDRGDGNREQVAAFLEGVKL